MNRRAFFGTPVVMRSAMRRPRVSSARRASSGPPCNAAPRAPHISYPFTLLQPAGPYQCHATGSLLRATHAIRNSGMPSGSMISTTRSSRSDGRLWEMCPPQVSNRSATGCSRNGPTMLRQQRRTRPAPCTASTTRSNPETLSSPDGDSSGSPVSARSPDRRRMTRTASAASSVTSEKTARPMPTRTTSA